MVSVPTTVAYHLQRAAHQPLKRNNAHIHGQKGVIGGRSEEGWGKARTLHGTISARTASFLQWHAISPCGSVRINYRFRRVKTAGGPSTRGSVFESWWERGKQRENMPCDAAKWSRWRCRGRSLLFPVPNFAFTPYPEMRNLILNLRSDWGLQHLFLVLEGLRNFRNRRCNCRPRPRSGLFGPR